MENEFDLTSRIKNDTMKNPPKIKEYPQK